MGRLPVQARIEIAATGKEQPIESEHQGPEGVEHRLESVGIGKDLKRIQAANDRNACDSEGKTSCMKDGIGDGLIEPVHLPTAVSQIATRGEQTNAWSMTGCDRERCLWRVLCNTGCNAC